MLINIKNSFQRKLFKVQSVALVIIRAHSLGVVVNHNLQWVNTGKETMKLSKNKTLKITTLNKLNEQELVLITQCYNCNKINSTTVILRRINKKTRTA